VSIEIPLIKVVAAHDGVWIHRSFLKDNRNAEEAAGILNGANKNYNMNYAHEKYYNIRE